MTYRHYIMVTKMNDSKEAYTAYCEKYHSTWGHMNKGMQDQFIASNYKLRFAIQW